jgi:hypothetical protein
MLVPTCAEDGDSPVITGPIANGGVTKNGRRLLAPAGVVTMTSCNPSGRLRGTVTTTNVLLQETTVGVSIPIVIVDVPCVAPKLAP